MLKLKRTLTMLSAIFILSACSSAYYSAMEKVGIHKRDIMVDRVEEAKEWIVGSCTFNRAKT